MQINQYHGSYNIQKRTTGVKYIVVHYTGSGTSKAGSARANCIYFSGGNRNASAHYFIDDSGIWEYANPSTYSCWHVGDGHGKYGITNQNSVGIEVCSSGADYTTAEKKYLRQLVGYLMNRFGVPASRVVRHYDASRKCCPAPYAPNGSDPTGKKWNALHSYITSQSGSTIVAKDEEDEVTNNDIAAIAKAVAEYTYGDSDKNAGHNMYNATHEIYNVENAISNLSLKSTAALITPTHDGQPLGYIAWWDGNKVHALDQEHEPLAIQQLYEKMGQSIPSFYWADNWFYRFVKAYNCADDEIVQKAKAFFPDEEW